MTGPNKLIVKKNELANNCVGYELTIYFRLAQTEKQSQNYPFMFRLLLVINDEQMKNKYKGFIISFFLMFCDFVF